MSGRARLCGHVGERVGSAVGDDVLSRHLQDGDAGGHLVQAAADHSFLDIQRAPAEPVVIPVAPLEGAVDEEFQYACCVLLRWFIGIH